jgi:hypothetical protein
MCSRTLLREFIPDETVMDIMYDELRHPDMLKLRRFIRFEWPLEHKEKQYFLHTALLAYCTFPEIF